MILKRFYDDKLAQASYLLGCAATGEALIVDPNRDVEQYVAAAEEEKLRITHVTETHIHADYVSGARELAALTGARLLLSDEGDGNWKYGFAADAGAELLRDGDHFSVGNVRIDVIHTPGHTPEHLSFVVTDRAAADEPMGVFTGDFLFVGDVGRPDLLERAARYQGTMEQGARVLFSSISRFRDSFPEYVQLWPGHGAGSACGKSLGGVPQTTLGYENRFNWALSTGSEDEFVEGVLAGQPEPPMYFAEMKRINRDGPRLLGGFHRPSHLPEARLEELLHAGAVIVDTRAAAEFASGHLPGTLNVPLGRSFTTWAGSVVPYDTDFYLIVEEEGHDALDETVRDLAMIGLDRIGGWFGAGVVQAWASDDRQLATVGEIEPARVEASLENGGLAVIDVRNGSEWEAGHIPGSINLPLGRLPEALDRIPRDRPLAVHCQTGARAAVALSVIRRAGFDGARHLSGDFARWKAEDRPVRTAAAAAAPA
jgi:hydroxyacylglutathione hydrolase